MNNKITQIGLIVEDSSDFNTVKILISKLIKRDKFKFSKFTGNGCGKMRRKALSYAKILVKKGCEMVILVHDLDRNDLGKLRKELEKFSVNSPANHNFVCIPREEIEAWLLQWSVAILSPA